MFGTVLDKVQSLFSRGFLLGAYFPVLIFAALNAAIAYYGLRGPHDDLATLKKAWWPDNGADQAIVTAALFMGLAVVAYVLSILSNLLRSLLEGGFPGPVRRAWIRGHQLDLATLQDLCDRAEERLIARTLLPDRLEEQLAAAVERGNAAAPPEPARVARAEAALREARSRVLTEESRTERLANAIDVLIVALSHNPTADAADEAQRATSAQLDRLAQQLRDELNGAIAEADRDYAAAWSAIRDNYVPNDVRPTRIGNLRAVTESYSEKAYGVRFDYLWPRLQSVLAKDDKIAQIVELSKAQLDSAVLMLSLAIGSTVVWFLVLALWGRSPWPFLVVAAMGPAAIRFFSVMVEQSQALFGVTVQSTIDASRFDLLTRMHISLPDRLSSEQARWQALQQMPNATGLTDVIYQHPKT